ncbi:hypothetical protein [Streptomyces turgidiscabies]|uniref:hypothetical protein n=1 Tax=Streptomyces turgidiscabies TaxID=85558 RepID=UPI0038F68F55
MATYPPIPPGTTLTSGLLTSMLPITATKTATESVTSSTTLQNDDQLAVPVEANATYEVALLLLHDSDATVAGDIKVAWTGPAGATMNWGVHGANTSAGSSTGVTSVNMQTRTIVEFASFGGGDSTGTVALVFGTLVTAGTAGTLQLQWAQETSNAVATNVRAGSRLTLTRTA